MGRSRHMGTTEAPNSEGCGLIGYLQGIREDATSRASATSHMRNTSSTNDLLSKDALASYSVLQSASPMGFENPCLFDISMPCCSQALALPGSSHDGQP